MYICERLIFLQLQKTGSQHITYLLSQIAPGRSLEIHSRPARKFLKSGLPIVGSIRNPWDWYVSLWSYGCSRRGILYRRLTRKTLVGFDLRKHPIAGVCQMLLQITKSTADWQKTYADGNDPALFRDWLCRLLDPKNKSDIGEKYLLSSISRYAGLLTYRYIYLFSREIKTIYDRKAPASVEELKELDRKNTALDYIIRNENLEHDLLGVLRECGIRLSAEQIRMVRTSQRMNTSARKRDLDYYYDRTTSELVANKEKFIMEKYGYTAPLPAPT